MSLIKKLLLFTTLTNLLLLAATYLFSSRIILNNINKLEREKTTIDVVRAHNVVLSELSYIVKLNQDYAGWDDTYKFIQDQNSAYIESNLVKETLTGNDLSIVAYYTNSGKSVFVKVVDLNLGTEMEAPKELLAVLEDPKLQQIALSAVPGKGPQGIYAFSDVLVLLSFEPILTSAKEGPPMGILVMGRYLDQTKVAELAKKAELEMDFSPTPTERELALKNTGVTILTEGTSKISGFTTITNVYGEPSEVLKITSTRDFFSESMTYIQFLIVGLTVIGLLSIVIGSLLGSQILLKPITALNNDISNVINSQNPKLRVKVTGEYEIRTISSKINEMLSALDKSTENLQSANQSLKEKADELEKFNKFMINRELRMIELKKGLRNWRTENYESY